MRYYTNLIITVFNAILKYIINGSVLSNISPTMSLMKFPEYKNAKVNGLKKVGKKK